MMVAASVDSAPNAPRLNLGTADIWPKATSDIGDAARQPSLLIRNSPVNMPWPTLPMRSYLATIFGGGAKIMNAAAPRKARRGTMEKYPSLDAKNHFNDRALVNEVVWTRFH